MTKSTRPEQNSNTPAKCPLHRPLCREPSSLGFAHHPVVLVGVGHAATAVKAWPGRYATLFPESDWRDVYVGLDEGKPLRRSEGSRSGFDIGLGAGAECGSRAGGSGSGSRRSRDCRATRGPACAAAIGGATTAAGPGAARPWVAAC